MTIDIRSRSITDIGNSRNDATHVLDAEGDLTAQGGGPKIGIALRVLNVDQHPSIDECGAEDSDKADRVPDDWLVVTGSSEFTTQSSSRE